jgi:membrane protease YdiL (CAAX protease family)
MVPPVRLFGEKKPTPLWRFGLVFTLFVIVGQIFMFILPLAPDTGILRLLVPFTPLILLLAALNGFSEEITMRIAPISPVFEVVGRRNAIWMAAILFGLAHYIGGIPSGIIGVLITTVLGWFFGKCLLDSKGFFWPWLFHTVQDLLPFTLMAIASLK